MLGAATTGFGTGFSLILAIGAQNAFVLQHGLMRRHVFALCLFCALSDAVLITAGVAGFGALTTALPWLPLVLTFAGAAFLIVYGIDRLRAARRGGAMLAGERAEVSLGRTLALAAAFTWANPHVYLDTLGLMGAVSVSFEGAAKLAFAVGAIIASFTFFFGLGYGARLLAPVMRRPRAWQVLDLVIAVTMFVIAAGLLWHARTL